MTSGQEIAALEQGKRRKPTFRLSLNRIKTLVRLPFQIMASALRDLATIEMLQDCRRWRDSKKNFLDFVADDLPSYDESELRRLYRGRMLTSMAYNVWEDRFLGALISARLGLLLTPLFFLIDPAGVIEIALTAVPVVAMLCAHWIRDRLRKALQLRESSLIVAVGILSIVLILSTLDLLPSGAKSHLTTIPVVISFEFTLPLLPGLIGLGGLLDVAFRLTRFIDFALMDRHRLKHVPNTTALLCMVTCAEVLSLENALGNNRRRKRLLNLLDLAGNYIAKGIPRATQVRGQANIETYAGRCREAGDYLASLQLWVALPREDTAQQLRGALKPVAAALLTGNYDKFPHFAAIEISATQRRHQALRVLRSLVTGALPFAIVLGFRKLGIEISGTLGDAVVIFCVAWAAVTYLAMLDPAFHSRISAIRELMTAVRQGKSQE